MQILTLINVQYLQYIAFSFEKFDWSNALIFRFQPLDKKSPQQNFLLPLLREIPPLNAIWKTLENRYSFIIQSKVTIS